MAKKSSFPPKGFRLPPAVAGIDVNACKNTACQNFGLPEVDQQSVRASRTNTNRYAIHGTGKFAPGLKCKSCKSITPIKSNAGVHEEFSRAHQYMVDAFRDAQVACPDASCTNHGLPQTLRPDAYSMFGKTKAGSQRYQCKACGKTFSIGSPIRRQRKPHKNQAVFKLLVTKLPIQQMCEVTDLQPQAFYGKIDFIHRQCLKFAAERESRIADLDIPLLNLSSDRQDFMVNWQDTKKKGTTQLSAIATADLASRFVFAHSLNYDPNYDPLEVMKDSVTVNDHTKPYPFRKYARLWTEQDRKYSAEKCTEAVIKELEAVSDTLRGDIVHDYNLPTARDDLLTSEMVDKDQRLPWKGMQVHAEYALYGHFFFLSKLFRNVGEVNFFLDQDSGIKNACLMAFAEKFQEHKAEALFVKIAKHLIVDDKKKIMAERKAWFKSQKKCYPGMTDEQVRFELILCLITSPDRIGPNRDKWYEHPFPSMSEPEKHVAHISPLSPIWSDPYKIAKLIDIATLHPVDRYFMLVRRRILAAERPIHPARRARRAWHLYAPYNPDRLQQRLDIFRVYYNYVKKGEDGKTPAQRLGLAKGPVKYEDIIYCKAPSP